MPTARREILQRWEAGEFILLTCDALTLELVEKLDELGLAAEKITGLARALGLAAEQVAVPVTAINRVITADPDDDIVVACAVEGRAAYLVTYDPHFAVLGSEYRGVKIVQGLPFLRAVRANRA